MEEVGEETQRLRGVMIVIFPYVGRVFSSPTSVVSVQREIHVHSRGIVEADAEVACVFRSVCVAVGG